MARRRVIVVLPRQGALEIGTSLWIEDVVQTDNLVPLNLIKDMFLGDKRYVKHPRGRWNLGCL